MKRWFALAGALLPALALAAPAVKPAPPPPPYAGVYQPQGVDEIGMWRDADEDERALANAPVVIRDEALNAYVKGVLCTAVGADRCNATRIYILRTPVFNASMAPNGTMRVFSGLLLRVHNEAELAAVLGHEFGHFERRHTVERFKASRSGSDLAAWASMLASMSNDYRVRSSLADLRVSVYGGLSRFGRDQEREADLLGIGYLNAGSLPPQSASVVWRHVMAEAEASATLRGLKKPQFDKIAFFASHPPEAERATYLGALAAPEAAARPDGADRYAKAMAPWLPMFLDDQIKLNDFGASEYVIEGLAQSGWSAWLWTARGDLFRSRGNPRDLVAAAQFYANAIALDPLSADAHRGLGLALFKTGRRSEGQAMLTRYLDLKPGASDAGMIRLLAAPTKETP